MDDQLVLRVITRLTIPFIIMFGCYVQLHGEYSPGGGFQAGVIVASAYVVFCLIYGFDKTKQVLSAQWLRTLATLGVLTYAGVGVVTMLMGGAFLDYNVLMADAVSGQKIGILLIELGVGLTVFSAMLLIFYLFVERKDG